MKVINLLENQKLIIILKARQLGITWLMAIYSLWKAKFHENVKVLFLSQGEEEAFDIVSKCKFLDNHLPDFLKSKRDPDQMGFIGFPDTNSEIKALPSTEKAGRSTDATLVVCDEWEFHPYAEQNFAALKPTIDAGGQFIAMSTADKTKLDTYFKKIYNGARGGFSSFTHLFLGALERPGRTIEWLKESAKDLRDWQREAEYPLTEQEALKTLKTRAFFNPDSVSQLKQFTREPVKCELSDRYQGIVKIYKLPVVGRRYCLFNDPSDGKEDPHAIVVRDYITKEWVATSHGKTTADQCAKIHDELVRFYNNAWNSYELNSRCGGIFSEVLDNLDTPNRCPFIDANGTLDKKGKKGWWTGHALKDKMLSSLDEEIHTMAITVYSKECLEEIEQFMIPEGGDPQPPGGGHDDFIMAGGGVSIISKYMPNVTGVVRSTPYRERWYG